MLFQNVNIINANVSAMLDVSFYSIYKETHLLESQRFLWGIGLDWPRARGMLHTHRKTEKPCSCLHKQMIHTR